MSPRTPSHHRPTNDPTAAGTDVVTPTTPLPPKRAWVISVGRTAYFGIGATVRDTAETKLEAIEHARETLFHLAHMSVTHYVNEADENAASVTVCFDPNALRVHAVEEAGGDLWSDCWCDEHTGEDME